MCSQQPIPGRIVAPSAQRSTFLTRSHYSTSPAAGFGLDMEMETSVRESHVIPGSANAILISACRAHRQPLSFTPRKLVATVADTIDPIRLATALHSQRLSLHALRAHHMSGTSPMIAKHSCATPHRHCQRRLYNPRSPVKREDRRTNDRARRAIRQGDLLIGGRTPSERERANITVEDLWLEYFGPHAKESRVKTTPVSADRLSVLDQMDRIQSAFPHIRRRISPYGAESFTNSCLSTHVKCEFPADVREFD